MLLWLNFIKGNLPSIILFFDVTSWVHSSIMHKMQNFQVFGLTSDTSGLTDWHAFIFSFLSSPLIYYFVHFFLLKRRVNFHRKPFAKMQERCWTIAVVYGLCRPLPAHVISPFFCSWSWYIYNITHGQLLGL